MEDHPVIATLENHGLSSRYAASTNGGEYKGPCPFCKGGQDRLCIWPNHPGHTGGFFWCRQCNTRGDMEELQRHLGSNPDATASSLKWSSVRRNPRASAPKQRKTPPSKDWQESIGNVVKRCVHDSAATNNNIVNLSYLNRGITQAGITSLHLGVSTIERFVKVGEDTTKIPKGLLIPNYRGDALFGVKVRTASGSPKYTSLKGSVQVPYVLLNTQDKLDVPVIIVESELCAALLHCLAGDLVTAIGMGSATALPDLYTKAVLMKASAILACLDDDAPGAEARSWWRRHYPDAHHILPPTGKDVTDFHLAGGDVRAWVAETITSLDSGVTIQSRQLPELNVKLVKKEDDARRLLQALCAENIPMALCIETARHDSASSDPALCKPKLLALSTRQQNLVFDLQSIPLDAFSDLATCDKIVTHDGVRLMAILRASGIVLPTTTCTMLRANALTNTRPELEELTQHLVGYSGSMYRPDFDKPAMGEDEYRALALDTHALTEVYSRQKALLSEHGKNKLCEVMRNAQYAVAEMMATGMHFDLDGHEQLLRDYEAAKDSEGVSDHALAALPVQWRENFRDCFSPIDGRIHALYKIAGATTGRMSCHRPNLQGVPRMPALRSLFNAEEGRRLIMADFSQMEFRVAAAYVQDDVMHEAFLHGLDIHRRTAAIELGIPAKEVESQARDAAKSLNFNFLYGGQNNINQDAFKAFCSACPKLSGWIRWTWQNRLSSTQVHTKCLRTIPRDSFTSSWGRSLLNYPIQGSAAEVIYAVLGKLPQLLSGPDARIIHCIHDEIILEVAERDASLAKEALEQAMIQGFQQIFPEAPTTGLVEAKVGKTWADAK